MKNKGFTLIEILSVIVVLAIVTLIAFPVIRGVVEKAKLKALEDSAYGLLEASNLYYAQYQDGTTVRFDKNEDVNTLKNLSYKGSVDKGTVIINQKGQTTVCITDGKNSAYKNYNESKVTLVARKTCNIPSNTYAVYLDDERTITELSNQELTERLIALENNLIDKIYPVGSIYTSTCGGTTDTDCLKTASEVEAKFGGTWEVYGDGRVLKSTTGTSGTTGGSNSVTLSTSNIPTLSVSGSTTATSTSSMSLSAYSAGSHSHGVSIGGGGVLLGARPGDGGYLPQAQDWGWAEGKSNMGWNSVSIVDGGAHSHSVGGSINIPALTVTGTYTNNSQTSVNVQNKYITVYMYKRVA